MSTSSLFSSLRASPARAAALVAPSSPRALVGRVVRQAGPSLIVVDEGGALHVARVAGALSREAASSLELPVVGDYVWLSPGDGDGDARIDGVLPRTSLLRRRAAGSAVIEQPIAANVDVVLLTCAIDGSLSMRRIERGAALAWDAGATPLVVLTKADLADPAELAAVIDDVRALGLDVVVTSALADPASVEAVRAAIGSGTAVLLGMSGAGKSTLSNALLGAASFATQPVRDDDERGRHTTTHRELVSIGAGALIDGPGVRELGMLADVDVDAAFEDVAALAPACRFRDCTHAHEPGCAVRAAVDAGELPADRLEALHKLQREAAFARAQVDPAAQRARKQRERALSRAVRTVEERKRPR